MTNRSNLNNYVNELIQISSRHRAQINGRKLPFNKIEKSVKLNWKMKLNKREISVVDNININCTNNGRLIQGFLLRGKAPFEGCDPLY